MNYNDIPLYNLLPGLLENESDPSRSTAFMLEDILKRLQKLEEHGGGGEGGPAVWGQITGTLSDQSDLQSKLNLKADKTALEAKADKTALDAKADKTYVDVMLESKANRSELDGLVTDNELSSALSTKADKSEIPDVSKLVTKDEVNAQLETKADAFLVKDGDLVLAPPASTVLPAADNIEPVLSLAKITQQNPFSDTQTIGVSKGAWTIKEIITDSVGRIKGRQATFLKVEDQTVEVKADVSDLKTRVSTLENGTTTGGIKRTMHNIFSLFTNKDGLINDGLVIKDVAISDEPYELLTVDFSASVFFGNTPVTEAVIHLDKQFLNMNIRGDLYFDINENWANLEVKYTGTNNDPTFTISNPNKVQIARLVGRLYTAQPISTTP